MTTFAVVLPLPSALLSPNARTHWAKKANAVKAARKCAWYWFRRYLPEGWKPEPVRIDVEYHCPGTRCDGYKPRDVDNALAALKPYLDGMVAAGVIPDDSAKWLELGRVQLNRRSDHRQPAVHIIVQPQGGA